MTVASAIAALSGHTQAGTTSGRHRRHASTASARQAAASRSGAGLNGLQPRAFHGALSTAAASSSSPTRAAAVPVRGSGPVIGGPQVHGDRTALGGDEQHVVVLVDRRAEAGGLQLRPEPQHEVPAAHELFEHPVQPRCVGHPLHKQDRPVAQDDVQGRLQDPGLRPLHVELDQVTAGDEMPGGQGRDGE